MKNFKSKFFLLILSMFFSLSIFASSYEGLSVSTQYPSLNVDDSSMIIFDLSIKNYQIAPSRVDLSISDLPNGWDSQFVGGGGKITAVFCDQDSPVSAQLWLVPPEDVKSGEYDITVNATTADGYSYQLPLTVYLGQKIPQRLAIESELSEIEGNPGDDFTFNVTIKNNSAAPTFMDLASQTPNGFKTTFKEQYGSKEINTLTIEAGKSSTLKVTVSPPKGIDEGTYPVSIIAKASTTSAKADIELNVKGQDDLSLTGIDGLLSFSAVAGKEKTFTLQLTNTGSAESNNIELSSSSPTNWKVSFNPEEISSLGSGEKTEIQMTVTPASEAITGDYQLKASASSDTSAISSPQFRVTVKTASTWGIISILIIAAAVIILLLATKKFGRR
jgi:uncharacterized membrane protein